MKKIDTTKKVVFAIGSLAVVTSVLGAIYTESLISQVFPLYMGLTLMGTVVLHKEESKN